jgi:hypothetical protein
MAGSLSSPLGMHGLGETLLAWRRAGARCGAHRRAVTVDGEVAAGL